LKIAVIHGTPGQVAVIGKPDPSTRKDTKEHKRRSKVEIALPDVGDLSCDPSRRAVDNGDSQAYSTARIRN